MDTPGALGVLSVIRSAVSQRLLRPLLPVHLHPKAHGDTGLTCNPGHVGRIGTGEPVRRDKVVQAKGIKPNLKGAKVQVAVRTLMAS